MGKVKKAVGGVAGAISGGLTGAGAAGSAIGGKVGDIITGGSLGLPTAKARSGEAAARAIKSEPFDISASTQKFGAEAAKQQQLSEQRQSGVLQQGRALRQQLADISAGKGPSLAEAQMRQAQDRNLSQQLAAAAAQRGGSPAALQRQLMRNQAQSGQQIAQDAGVARMQEGQAARQQLGQMVAQEQAAADQSVNNYLQMGFSMEQAQAKALQDLEQLRQGARAGQAALGTQASIANQQAQSQLLGGLIGGAGSLLALSDKVQKKNVKDAKKPTSDFLNALKAKEYNYKDESKPGTSPGKNYGIMAQDLEKSLMGKSLVVDTPNGKMVDVKRGFGAALAAMADLNQRTAELERALKKRKMRKGAK